MTVTRLLPDSSFGLGESPLWDDRRQALFWIDISAATLHRIDPETMAHTAWTWPEKISCLGLTDGGVIMVGGRSGLWRFDPESGDRALTHPIPELPDSFRTNDGKVGPDGAFWVSTMDDRDDRGPDGYLMRIGPKGDVQIKLHGITTPNGIEWSPDGRTMYLSDTRELWIDCWDFSPETGEISNRRRFASLPEGGGKPDGAAVDAAGNYWISAIYGGEVRCLSPEGVLISTVAVPATMPTMPCFGGKDLQTVFVTSLMRAGPPVAGAGGLYSFRAPAPGRPSRRMHLD